MRKILKKVAKLLCTILIFLFLFTKFDLSINKIFSDVKNWWFIAAGIFTRLIIIQTIAMNRWKIFLEQAGIKESIWALTKISFVSSFLGVVLPSSQGGDVMRMYFIEKKYHFSKEKEITVGSTVIVERMIGFVILAFIGLVSCVFVPYFEGKRYSLFLIGLINCLLWIVILILTNKKLYQFLSSLLKKFNRWQKVLGFIEKTHHSLTLFPYQKILLPSVIIIGFYQLVTVIVLYFVFLSFGIEIPFYNHLAFYPIIAILSIIPVSISGLGLREGFFVFFYSALGITADVAVKVSLINYCVEVLSAVVTGGVLYSFIQFKLIKPIDKL